MATVGLGFTLSANAQQMASGINAGVVELQKLGYAAKRTAADVATLRNIEIGRAFISATQAVVNTFTNFTSGAASAVDSTLKLSRSLGISYQELRQLQLAADLSGASSEQLATAFTKAQVTIVNAGKGGKEAVADLKALGLTVDDLAGKSVTDQFSAIASAINRIQDPAQRAAAAVGVFGKSGAQLLPVFSGLPDSLRQAQGFLDQFKGGLTGVDAARIEQLNDAFTLTGQAVQELAGKLLAQLQPALQAGAEQFVAFVARLDVSAIASAATNAVNDLVNIFSAFAQVAAPLSQNILPAIGGYLAFINRQAIGAGIVQLARAFGAAATAGVGYSAAAGAASVANVTLAASFRALLASTGVGLLVVALGAAGGALIEYGLSGQAAGADVAAATAAAEEQTKQAEAAVRSATTAVQDFGQEAKLAFKLPAEITDQTLLQGTVDAALSAFKQFAQEAGRLDAIPQELADAFDTLQTDVDNVNRKVIDIGSGEKFIAQSAAEVLAIIERRKKALDAEKKATEAVAEASRKASEDARKRVQELVDAGLPDAERSRLTLNKDLLAIQQTIADAEKQFADARAAGDSAAVAQAEERLRITRETAAAATDAAKEQARQRDLEALGFDSSLLKPAVTVKDEFLKVRQAFDKGLIDGGQARNALQKLAADGIQIRKEIAAELSRPSSRALEVNDVRTQAGFASFVSMASGRPDPAIEQRSQQLVRLDEIRRALVAIGARPVEILGG